MLGVLIISFLTILFLILAIIFKPEIRVRKRNLETFWLVSLFGAICLIIFRYISIDEAYKGITNSSSINPIKILIIFISMTILSVVLDELGFFNKLAFIALRRAKEKQIKIFFYLYITISILTIFTSNDIIILTFTPFICYFTKSAKINPIPYLISEFVAANTWSMMLIIGNPTNIYLASAYGIDFLSYLKIMFIPTTVSALVALGILLLIFNKSLQKPIEAPEILDYPIISKKLLVVALMHLIVCTILLTIASYLNLEMWYICLSFALSILIIILVYETIKKKRKPVLFIKTIKRSPWSLIPFVLSMFTFVLTLSKFGVTKELELAFRSFNSVFSYGISSFLFANVINNIPMTVLYSEIIRNVTSVVTGPIYASIIGSNLGAYFTPIGALAGIMWMRILKRENIKLSFIQFIRYGLVVSIPTLFVALVFLFLMI